ncbi:MAG: hypothetical protein Q9163_004897 [Psora crenata]
MPNANEAYEELTTLLHPACPPKVLELDILPSSCSSSFPQIQYSAADSALGIDKAILIQCFLIARTRFFATAQQRPEPVRSDEGDGAKGKNQQQEDEEEEEIRQATSVMLLWDPNHHTAINWRKRFLLRELGATRHREGEDGRHEDDERKGGIVEEELRFLESLLTSPLPKHTKSSTLWSHRLWLLRTVPPHSFCPGGVAGADGYEGIKPAGVEQKKEVDTSLTWKRELGIVMSAGERHPRNYYAWNYARDCFGLLFPNSPAVDAFPHRIWTPGMLTMVNQWCLMHPRDISGWTFLSWICESMARDTKGTCEGVMMRTIWETVEFVRKYKWRGESVERFLKTVERLAGSSGTIAMPNRDHGRA